MSTRRQSVRVAASVVVAALCWAGSPATGNAERAGQSGGGAASEDGSTPGRTARGSRTSDAERVGPIRPGRLGARSEGAAGSGGRSGRLPAADGDSGGPGDSSPTGGLVGLGETGAAAAAAELGFTVRIVARDGEWFPVTKDYREDRINIVVENGAVVRAFVG